MEKLTDLANKSDEFKHGYCNGRIDEEYLWKCKIKSKIEELDKEYKEAYNKGFKTDMVNRLREIKLIQSLLGKE